MAELCCVADVPVKAAFQVPVPPLFTFTLYCPRDPVLVEVTYV
ncbi:hypothetical protein ACQPZZ_31145 [Microbispora sp. CA-135349]